MGNLRSGWLGCGRGVSFGFFTVHRNGANLPLRCVNETWMVEIGSFRRGGCPNLAVVFPGAATGVGCRKPGGRNDSFDAVNGIDGGKPAATDFCRVRDLDAGGCHSAV